MQTRRRGRILFFSHRHMRMSHRRIRERSSVGRESIVASDPFWGAEAVMVGVGGDFEGKVQRESRGHVRVFTGGGVEIGRSVVPIFVSLMWELIQGSLLMMICARVFVGLV